MEKASWEMINGSKSIYNLTRIIERACGELGIAHNWKACSSDYTAQFIDGRINVHYFFNDSKLYFCIYDNPPEELTESAFGNNDYGAFFDFDKNCFFHKDLDGQVESIKSFIKTFQSWITI
jgi:hypothetical protein